MSLTNAEVLHECSCIFWQGHKRQERNIKERLGMNINMPGLKGSAGRRVITKTAKITIVIVVI